MKSVTKETVLKQGDKSYPAIQIEQGIVWIDKNAEIKEDDWYIDFSLDKPSLYQMKYKQWGEEGHPNCKKIITATFELEGVPKIELKDQVEKLAQSVMINYLTNNNPDGDFKHSTIGTDDNKNWWVAGYKANQAKYTEEDIRDALRFALNSAFENPDLDVGGKIVADLIDNYLQSLNSIKEITVDENFKTLV